MRLTAQQLKQFSNECLALRRLLELGSDFTDAEKDCLRTQVRALLAELDGLNAGIAARREPAQDRPGASAHRGSQPC